MKRRLRFKIVGIVFLWACTALSTAQQALENAEIIKMHNSGLGDDLLVSIIQSQAGSNTLTSDSLVALKSAGVSDKVVSAMLAKTKGSVLPPTNSAAALKTDGQSPPSYSEDQAKAIGKPRVFLQSVSSGNNLNAKRDQSMEMGKDFEKDCPSIRITINQQLADYTVVLNHIEQGFIRDNQVQIADKNGDLLAKTKEGGSISGAVKKACVLIEADWAKNKPSTP